MTTATIEVMDLAREMGFEHWLGEDQTKGWYTCLMTGKKFRGEVAKQMLKGQEQAMAEREEEIERKEQEQEMKADEQMEMDIDDQEEDIESPEAADEAAQENAEFAATIGKKPMTASQAISRAIGADEVPANEHMTEKLAVHLEIKLVEGKPVKMTTIHCEDCGTPRDIKVQDAFQVTRCPECQKKHRNKKRAERRRQQRAEAKAAKAE